MQQYWLFTERGTRGIESKGVGIKGAMVLAAAGFSASSVGM